MNNSRKKQLKIKKIFADPMDIINQAIRVTIRTNDAPYFNEFCALKAAASRFLRKAGYLKIAKEGKHKGHVVICKGWPTVPLDLWSRK